jgi:hypothetical protein
LDALQGHDVRVFAYLRRPDEILVSADNQCVRDYRHRRTEGITEKPRPYDPTYSNILSRWIERKDIKLTLAPYDPKQWVGGSICSDFLSMIGVNGDHFEILDERANLRLSPLITDILRSANRIPLTREQHDALVQALYGLSTELFPHTPFLDEAICQLIEPHLDRYRPFFREGFDERFLLGL